MKMYPNGFAIVFAWLPTNEARVFVSAPITLSVPIFRHGVFYGTDLQTHAAAFHSLPIWRRTRVIASTNSSIVRCSIGFAPADFESVFQQLAGELTD